MRMMRLPFCAAVITAALAPCLSAQQPADLRAVLITGRAGASTSGQILRPQPVIRVTDANGKPVAGIPVAAFIISPTGIPDLVIDGAKSITSEQGEAVFDSLRVSSPHTLEVDVSFLVRGEQDKNLLLHLTVTKRRVAEATITVFPVARIVPGVVLNPAPQVKLRDDLGGPSAAVAVRLTVLEGDQSFTGNTAVTNAAGVATFGEMQLAGASTAGQSKVVAQVHNGQGWETIGQPIGFETGASPLAALEALEPIPQSARAGEYFDIPLTLVAKDALGNPKVGQTVLLQVTSGDAQLYGSEDTTNAEGKVSFIEKAALFGRGGTEVSIMATSAGKSAGPFKILLRTGPPAVIEILDQPPTRVISDSVFGRNLRVRVTDNSGNPLEKQEVRVELANCQVHDALRGKPEAIGRDMKVDLFGPATRRTGETGEAVFDSLGISGEPGACALKITLPSAQKLEKLTNAFEYDPDVSLNRNFVAISAIKSIAGEIPDDEFFDIRFRYRIWRRVFVISATDIALTSRSTDSVRSSQRKLTEASISGNFTFHQRTDPRNGVPERDVFVGAVVKVFNTLPYAGIHLGVVELAGSAFQGSTLTFGPVLSLYSSPVVIRGNTVRPQRFNILADFLVRSSSVDFFKNLNIRGSVLLPVARGIPLSSRIGIAVPVGTLHIY